LPGRNHWSLFPVVFGRRCPSLDIYDELMGILMHGCVGESIGPKLNFLRESANIVTIDVITSKSSTLPYDGDDMRRMIRLVQAAKGMLVFRREENNR